MSMLVSNSGSGDFSNTGELACSKRTKSNKRKKNKQNKKIYLDVFGTGPTDKKVNSLFSSIEALDKLDPIAKVKPVRVACEKDLNVNYKGIQKVNSDTVINKILFSQNTVSDCNMVTNELGGKIDEPISELASAMFIEYKKGFDVDGRFKTCALNVILNEDSTLTSLDNRRLLIAKKIAKIDPTYTIFIKINKAADKLTLVQERRFEAKTWGEAVKNRMGERAKKNGFGAYPKIISESSTGWTEKENQKISIDLRDVDLSDMSDEIQKNIKKKTVDSKLVV